MRNASDSTALDGHILAPLKAINNSRTAREVLCALSEPTKSKCKIPSAVGGQLSRMSAFVIIGIGWQFNSSLNYLLKSSVTWQIQDAKKKLLRKHLQVFGLSAAQLSLFWQGHQTQSESNKIIRANRNLMPRCLWQWTDRWYICVIAMETLIANL